MEYLLLSDVRRLCGERDAGYLAADTPDDVRLRQLISQLRQLVRGFVVDQAGRDAIGRELHRKVVEHQLRRCGLT